MLLQLVALAEHAAAWAVVALLTVVVLAGAAVGRLAGELMRDARKLLA